MYTPVNSKQNFPQLEEEVLAFWDKNSIFRKSVEAREEY
jgi:isoleucyl-tRNA synthetase